MRASLVIWFMPNTDDKVQCEVDRRGIPREHTLPDTPQCDEMVERVFGVLREKTEALPDELNDAINEPREA